MEVVEDAVMLRIYLGESDKVGHLAAYKAIVHKLRELGIWGATVIRGHYGYGKKSVLHTASPLRLSEDLPIVIEAVDNRQKIEGALPRISSMVQGGLIVILDVQAHVHME